jgi:phage terminase small subunit
MANAASPKQMLFALEYLKDLNATRAYRDVYGAKNDNVAAVEGSKLLRNPKVAPLIQHAMDKRVERTGLDADKVLTELGHMAYLDPLEMYDERNCLKPIAQIPETLRRAIASIKTEELFKGRGDDREMIGYTKEVKLWNKPGSLELHGKHLKLFTDKVEHSVSDSLASLILSGQKQQ